MESSTAAAQAWMCRNLFLVCSTARARDSARATLRVRVPSAPFRVTTLSSCCLAHTPIRALTSTYAIRTDWPTNRRNHHASSFIAANPLLIGWSRSRRGRGWVRSAQRETPRRCADMACPAEIAATGSLTSCAGPVGTPRPAIPGALGPKA
jgi:hypothetical protein